MIPATPARRRMAALLLCVGAASPGCSGPDVRETAGSDPEAAPAPERNFRARTYERNFVFSTLSGDSTLVVPWLTTAQSRPGGVERTARAWLVRSGSWEQFNDEAWTTQPTGVPGRILPHGAFRLLVRQEDAIGALLYEEGARALELSLADVLMEWIDSRGASYRIVGADVYFGDRRVSGLALDMSRVRESSQVAPGDWAFLVSGDSLQLVLESPERADPGTEGAYRAWARLDFRDLRFGGLTVEWAEVRAFAPARQDIPVAWTLTSGEGDLEGVLEVRTAHVEAGQGDGPVLPVDALFEVTGTVSLEGRSFPVRGLYRHARD